MTQLSFDETAQRALPVPLPLQQGIGPRVDDRYVNQDRTIELSDVVELERRIDGTDLSYEQRPLRQPSDYAPPPQSFEGGRSGGGFAFDRDVVANLYAANETSNSAGLGGSLDLVA